MMVGSSYPATLSSRSFRWRTNAASDVASFVASHVASLASSCRALDASSAVNPTSPSWLMSIPVALSTKLTAPSAAAAAAAAATWMHDGGRTARVTGWRPLLYYTGLHALVGRRRACTALSIAPRTPPKRAFSSGFLPLVGCSCVILSLGWLRLSICAALIAPGLLGLT